MRPFVRTAALAVSSLAAGLIVGTAHQAAATQPPAQPKDQAACSAFFAWASHPGAQRFHTFTVRLRGTDTYLRVDGRLLVHDEHRHAARKVIRADMANLDIDCTLTGDQG